VYEAKNNGAFGIFVTNSHENMYEAIKVVEKTLAKLNVDYSHPIEKDPLGNDSVTVNDFHLANGGRIGIANDTQEEDVKWGYTQTQ